MKRTFIYATVLLICAVGITVCSWWGKSEFGRASLENLPVQVIQVGGRDVHVTIADTISSRERGLGDRTGLAPDEGMLFVFASDAKYGFWMKDMHFPIDILWLSGRGEVLDMRKDVSPATYPAIFTPKAPARFVLELPAGFSEAYNVKIGDEVKMR